MTTNIISIDTKYKTLLTARSLFSLIYIPVLMITPLKDRKEIIPRGTHHTSHQVKTSISVAINTTNTHKLFNTLPPMLLQKQTSHTNYIRR